MPNRSVRSFNTPKSSRRKPPQPNWRYLIWLSGVILVVSLLLGSQLLTQPSYASTLDWQTTETAPSESALVFAVPMFAPPGQDTPPGFTLAKKSTNQVNSLMTGMSVDSTELDAVAASNPIPTDCQITNFQAAPRGPWLAVELDCSRGHGTVLQVVHARTGEAKWMGAELGRDTIFLGWSPTGNEIIVRANVIGESHVYLIHVASGKETLLNVPTDTYNVAISQNGQRLVYSLTHGLGFGSETWVADIDGSNAQQVIADSTHIIAYARFSPNGDQIAYIRMADSNIPFTVGEVWVMNVNGGGQTWLGEADAGHGYGPDWSPDGMQIAFVHRDNGDDVTADQVPNQLASNIHVADVITGVEQAVTNFSDTLVEAPVWSPDGAALAFAAKPRHSLGDIWAVSPGGPDKQPHQVTQNSNAQFPTWTSDK
jgi:tricorn protease-like protein